MRKFRHFSHLLKSENYDDPDKFYKKYHHFQLNVHIQYLFHLDLKNLKKETCASILACMFVLRYWYKKYSLS